MPLENTPPAIDDAVATALATDMQAIIDTLAAFNINLTTEDRKEITSIGPQRTAFMVDYFGNKNDYEKLKPPFLDEGEADKHWELRGRLLNIKTKAAQMLELVDDIKLNSEHFAFQYALEGYATVQRGKDKNVPGADTFYDLLSPYFDGQGGGSEPPSPSEPEPPTP